MKGVNKVIIIGTLGQDPEVRYSASGNCIANLSVATNESWTDKEGNKQEKTEWHRCVLFGKVAEIAGQYLKKGSQVYLEGKLQTNKWQDKDGKDRYTTEIHAREMQMLGGKGGHDDTDHRKPETATTRESDQTDDDNTFYENIPF